MTYFTWRESGLTADCSSLEAMAALEAALPADARRRATTPQGLFD